MSGRVHVCCLVRCDSEMLVPAHLRYVGCTVGCLSWRFVRFDLEVALLVVVVGLASCRCCSRARARKPGGLLLSTTKIRSSSWTCETNSARILDRPSGESTRSRRPDLSVLELSCCHRSVCLHMCASCSLSVSDINAHLWLSASDDVIET